MNQLLNLWRNLTGKYELMGNNTCIAFRIKRKYLLCVFGKVHNEVFSRCFFLVLSLYEDIAYHLRSWITI